MTIPPPGSTRRSASAERIRRTPTSSAVRSPPASPRFRGRSSASRSRRGSADQVFSRSFANGAWTTRGNGTVGGRSSASPKFTGSLNFDQGQNGEAPSIDFAGAGRTVPWATWYENTTGTGFGQNNVFASRFDNTGDANQGKWIFAGQSRGNGGSGPERSVAQHPYRPGRREPIGGRRLRGRSDQAGAVGDLAGDVEQQRARTRSSSTSPLGREWRTATA